MSEDLIDQLEELQVLLEEAKAVPLSGSAVVNREEVLELLVAIKESVPDEIRQARWMLRDHQELLDKTRKEAEEILREASERRERMVAESDLVAAASRRSERIVAEAEREAARLLREAHEYVDDKLAEFEALLRKTLGTVERGRQRLHAGLSETPEKASDLGK